MPAAAVWGANANEIQRNRSLVSVLTCHILWIGNSLDNADMLDRQRGHSGFERC